MLIKAVGVFLKQMDRRQGALHQGCVTQRSTQVLA